MAQTQPQPNNAAVKFRGTTEREMAFEPKPAIGDEVAALPKAVKPLGVKRLPKGTRKKARKMAMRGMISPKAMKTHFGSE
jgi:hypothetical protein